MFVSQYPEAGGNYVKYAGDIIELILSTDIPQKGQAFLRTNYNGVTNMQNELISSVEKGTPILMKNWRDLPMSKQKEGVWKLNLPLTEIGTFEFKGYFLPVNGKREWVKGENLRIKVEPAATFANNTIYNAFIRQFGPNISGQAFSNDSRQAASFLDKQGYTVIPPSGTFADFQKQLDHIIHTMGFRNIMFLPIHPSPTSFARMGRFGSPFAPLDFFTVDASMAVFDRKTTPLEQFIALVDDIHSRKARVLIDIPIDHTGWASSMQVHYPEWFLRGGDGSFESPGAWGVIWADLCKLNFKDKRLWTFLADMLLHWCRQGVDGFRCDAGYMIPLPVWQYIIAKVRTQYPDTIFLLEGLGGAWELTQELLLNGGMNWAYSESFQQFGKEAESNYLTHALYSATHYGTLVNFAETHDNNRLAASSPRWARLRIASAAMLAPSGAFAMTNGVEWLATEKIDVHESSSLNWGASENCIELIAQLNRILTYHPAFRANAELSQPPVNSPSVIALIRKNANTSVLILVNTDMEYDSDVQLSLNDLQLPETVYELISNQTISIQYANGEIFVNIPAATVYCLSISPFELSDLPSGELHYDKIEYQERKDCALKMLLALYGEEILEQGGLHLQADYLAGLLYQSPTEYIKKLLENKKEFGCLGYSPLSDQHRIVMLPQKYFLYIEEQYPFVAELIVNGKTIEHAFSLHSQDGSEIALFANIIKHPVPQITEATLKVKVFNTSPSQKVTTCEGKLWLLPSSEHQDVSMHLPADKITAKECGLCVNTSGSYSLVRASWGTIQSKYDALMAINYSKDFPDDRTAVLIRYRAWLRYLDFSNELNLAAQLDFQSSFENCLVWNFQIPCGFGNLIHIKATWRFDSSRNCGQMTFEHIPSSSKENGIFLQQGEPLTLIVRPDIDFRSTHGVTKAYQGAEKQFPDSVHPSSNGFTFSPFPGRCLELQAPQMQFHTAPEWKYSNAIPIEQERALEDCLDLFSPGYFEVDLFKNSSINIISGANEECQPLTVPATLPKTIPLPLALRKSLNAFIVKRDDHQSIIAGYPWFLDWGRDTLICLRGVISAGLLNEAQDMICQFAQFEHQGTLPNMIRGKDTSDRDTSDAPLWLLVAIEDFIKKSGEKEILNMNCQGRPLKQVLLSLVENMWAGAPNGVKADPQTGLLFSPPHFTWMDTNYPAGTPRAGYPVEIQALWIKAITFVSQNIVQNPWKSRGALAKKSLKELFVRADGLGLVDCRHTPHFQSAALAVPDDAIRPNQLLAITLGILQEKSVIFSILSTCQCLLIPGGIRSLDDSPVHYPISIVDKGHSLNDPYHPYWGIYSGCEDTHRKPAYHNGTAWSWQMPLYCEANWLYAGSKSIEKNRALLTAACEIMSHGCLGYLPEIYDGNTPHLEKGCCAQAWGMTEFYRVFSLLENQSSQNK